MTMPAEECRHITVRMPVDMVARLEELAAEHHRDRSGEIIHACALYIAAHEAGKIPEVNVAVLQAIEKLREIVIRDIEDRDPHNPGHDPPAPDPLRPHLL